jgi:hypothetical protein
MKVLYTVELDNRHHQESELLTAMVKDTVVDFNRRTRAEANVKFVRLISDEIHDFLLGRMIHPRDGR